MDCGVYSAESEGSDWELYQRVLGALWGGGLEGLSMGFGRWREGVFSFFLLAIVALLFPFDVEQLR